MSPERLAGKVTRKTDVWAFGMTAHEVLMGRPPFEGVDSKGVMRVLLGSKNTPVGGVLERPGEEEVQRGYSMGVRRVLESCLNAAPAGRPSFEALK